MRLPVRSLAFRLVTAAVMVQSLCLIVAMIVFPLVAPNASYRMIADGSVRRQLLVSIARENGVLRIKRTSALATYMKSRPSLRYAVRDETGRYAQGSSEEMIAILRRIGPFVRNRPGTYETVRPGHPGDAVFVTKQASSVGPLVIASGGDSFAIEDVPSFFVAFLPDMLPAYGPVLLGVLFGIPLVVRRMFRPVEQAARSAALISVYALDQRLPTAGMPSEFSPLVIAINEALDRVSDGWTRQRLFTANAAHELRTPVAVLQARVETLPSNAPLRAALTRDVRRLGLLIDQLLAIARLERRDIVLQRIDLVALMRDLVADWAPVAIRSRVTLEFSSERPAIYVLGEARALESAVAALIDNALKVEPEGEIIEVAVMSGARVVVRDHGPGVATEDHRSVFEPFWRKDERPAGSGLGLATVRETARLHGGYARVDDRPDAGAAFEMFIPEIQPHET